MLAGEDLPPHDDVRRYDAVLERLDTSLRPLLERREQLNIVLLADHAERLGDGASSTTVTSYAEK